MKISCTFLDYYRTKVITKRLKLDECNCVNLRYGGTERRFVVPAKPLQPLVYCLDDPKPLDVCSKTSGVIAPQELRHIMDMSFIKALGCAGRSTSWSERFLGVFRRRRLNFGFEVVASYIEKAGIPYDLDGTKVFVLTETHLKAIREGRL